MGVGDGEGHVAVIGLTVGDAGDDRGVGVLICHMAAAAQQLLVQPDVLVLGMGDHVHAADHGNIAVDDAAVGIGVALRQKGGAEAAIALRDLAEVAAGESAASAGRPCYTACIASSATSLPPWSMVTSPVKVPPVTVTVSEMVTAPRKLPPETEEPSCRATAP